MNSERSTTRPGLLLGLVLAVFQSIAWAAPASAEVQGEINALLDRLAASGCQFQRNGTWYAGQDARTHLAEKLNYIQGKTTLKSAEQFIEMAASKSSMSGKPYQVRCGAEAPLSSAAWLSAQLKALRGGPAGASR